MRPVLLTITAFGPYAETENIDFSKLEGRSMFVVSGRTGAGKTTIFDAMTFALYGRASGALRNASDFRSQYAPPELKTEVDFSFTIREETYRIVRQPQQPHPKNKTPIPHEAVLYEWEDGWKPLATKVNEVQERIEDILQLSYEQFSQILLLPQNQFRQLLDSNSNEKQQILQSIFKTEAYRTFQEQWAERHSKYRKQVEWAVERTRLKLLELEDDQIEEMATRPVEEILRWLEEREQKLLERKEGIESQKREQGIRLETERQKLGEATNLVGLFDEREVKRKALEKFEAEATSRTQQHERLQRLEAASRVRPVFDRLTESERRVRQLVTEEQLSSKKWEELKRRQLELSSNAETINVQKNEMESHKERLRVIEELMPHLDERAQLVKERDRLKEQAKQLETFQQEEQLLKLQRQEHELTKELEHQPTERAIDAERELDRYVQLSTREKKLTDLKERLVRCERDGKDVQRQYQSQSEVVARFEQAERKLWARRLSETLSDGEPCPVCGSRHHDVAPHQEPAENLIEQERATELLKQLEAKLYEARADYRSLHHQVEEARAEFEEAATGINMDQSLEQTTSSLKIRVIELQKKEQERADKERLSRQVTMDLKRLEQQRREQFEERQRMLNRIESIQVRLQEIGRIEEGSLEDFKKEQFKLTERVAVLEKAITAHEKELEEVNKATWKEEERTTLYREQLKDAKALLTTQSKELSQKLAENGLLREEYEQLAGQIDQQSSLREQLKQQEEEGVRLRHALQVIEEKLGDVNKPDIAAITERVNEAQTTYERTSNDLVTAADALSRHRQIVREWTDHRTETASEEKKLETIKLIADTGKGLNPQKMAFETYVQTAFFDQILHAANIHLDQMTSGQFRLERKIETAKGNAKSGLELLVFDAYTGQSRRVQNLSGGEGFKASLSLALGLAEVVQQLSGGVSLETMLIDEGFGTLDAESLDQAIELLMSLQSSGRLVGVISHVQELKDRVDARIEVKKSRSGSTIQLIVE